MMPYYNKKDNYGVIKKDIEDDFKLFMRECFHKGPLLEKVYIMGDCITIYCKGILTPLEKDLAEADLGEYYVKILREKTSKTYKDELISMIEEETGEEVKSFFLDFDVIDDSLCCTFILKNSI